MCLIAVAYKIHPRFPLIVAANRDEFLDREADAAHFWPDHPVILAGRDRRAKGTWMGITLENRFAAVTNFRDLSREPVAGPSRGLLVRDALLHGASGSEHPMEGYNLLHGRIEALRYQSNISGDDFAIAPGVHALSNALLNTPWPKVELAKKHMAEAVSHPMPDASALFAMLGDGRVAADDALPDTGLDLLRERALSAIRIDMPGYGTRCSTVLMVDMHGHVRFEERTHATGGIIREEFQL